MKIRHVTFTFDGVIAGRQHAQRIAIQTLRNLSTNVDGLGRAGRSAGVDVAATRQGVERDGQIVQRTTRAVTRRLARRSE